MSAGRRWLIFVDLVRLLHRCPRPFEVRQATNCARNTACAMVKTYHEHCARLR